MAGVHRFEDLRVWQEARRQSASVSALIRRPEFTRNRELANQIDGASLSVMNNIAEGFLRHSDKQFRQFLRIAAGSNGDVRSCLCAASTRGCLEKSEADDLIERTNVIGRMLRRLQSTLDA